MANSDVNENYKSDKSSETPTKRPPLDKHDLTTDPELTKRVLADTKMSASTAGEFPAEEKLLAQLTEPNKAGVVKADNGESKFTKAPENKISPIEKDANEKIKRINYPDGSYHTIDYNAYGKPTVATKYGSNNQELERVNTANADDSPIQLKVHDDGTIEKNTRKVSYTPDEDIYDRQGNKISSSTSLLVELLLQESWKPDGSHSLKREYPDKSSREIISKPGEPNIYNYKRPDGQQQIWTQESGTNKWYKAEDTEHEKPWTGKEEFRPDSRFIRTAADGNVITEIASNGSEMAPDKNIWKQDVLAVATEKLTDKATLTEFTTDINDIDERVKAGKLSAIEAAKTYQQIYRGLTTKSRVGVSEQNMFILTRQIADEQAHPEDIDQGSWPNCHSAAPKVKLSHTDSSIIAKLQLDAAITGKYTDTRGITVDITKSIQPADKEGLKVKFPADSDQRSYAGQLFDVVAHNLCLADSNKTMGTNLEYVQKPVSKGDNGARIMDNNEKPPREVYSLASRAGSLDRKIPIHKSSPVLDDNGIKQLDINLQPKMTAPMDGMPFIILDSLNLAERLTGRSMAGEAIGHFDQAGQADNWIWDKVGLANHIRRDERVPFFKTEADLEQILLNAKKTGKFPIILETNAGGGKLGEQVAAATGKPLGGAGGFYGGGHVLCISDYDSSTKTSSIDGTWGLKRDIPKATLKDILDMSSQPEHLRKEQASIENDIKLAYKQWCKDNRKQWNIDFPIIAEGKEYLYQFRRMREDRTPTPKMNQ